MRNFDDHAAIALRELDSCLDLLMGVTGDDWKRPTPCTGWDVEALGRHLAAVVWQQGEAFNRARIGVTEAPSWLQITDEVREMQHALSAGRELVAGGLDALAPVSDRLVPLPFAVLPATTAGAGLVLEYGVHRADLERALGRTADHELDAEVAAVVVSLLGALLPFIATKPPEPPLTYRLLSPSATIPPTSTGTGWRPGDGADVVCELHGSDAAIALVSLGRIPVDHPALIVDDPTGAAPSFATHVPGL